MSQNQENIKPSGKGTIKVKTFDSSASDGMDEEVMNWYKDMNITKDNLITHQYINTDEHFLIHIVWKDDTEPQ